MTEAKHTPGPWKWHWRQEDGKATGSVFAEPREGHAYAVAMCPQYQTRTRWEADARLIVAAHDAFDFAVAYDAYMADQFPEGPTSSAIHPKASAIWTHCRATIAKATGAE